MGAKGATNCKPMSMYLEQSTLAGTTHMAASMNNIDGKKTEINQLIELMRAELNKVKADLKDELDKVNATSKSCGRSNVSRCPSAR